MQSQQVPQGREEKRAEVTTDFAGLQSLLLDQFQRLNQRFDTMEEKLAATNQRIDSLAAEVRHLDQRNIGWLTIEKDALISALRQKDRPRVNQLLTQYKRSDVDIQHANPTGETALDWALTGPDFEDIVVLLARENVRFSEAKFNKSAIVTSDRLLDCLYSSLVDVDGKEDGIVCIYDSPSAIPKSLSRLLEIYSTELRNYLLKKSENLALAKCVMLLKLCLLGSPFYQSTAQRSSLSALFTYHLDQEELNQHLVGRYMQALILAMRKNKQLDDPSLATTFELDEKGEFNLNGENKTLLDLAFMLLKPQKQFIQYNSAEVVEIILALLRKNVSFTPLPFNDLIKSSYQDQFTSSLWSEIKEKASVTDEKETNISESFFKLLVICKEQLAEKAIKDLQVLGSAEEKAACLTRYLAGSAYELPESSPSFLCKILGTSGGVFAKDSLTLQKLEKERCCILLSATSTASAEARSAAIKSIKNIFGQEYAKEQKAVWSGLHEDVQSAILDLKCFNVTQVAEEKDPKEKLLAVLVEQINTAEESIDTNLLQICLDKTSFLKNFLQVSDRDTLADSIVGKMTALALGEQSPQQMLGVLQQLVTHYPSFKTRRWLSLQGRTLLDWALQQQNHPIGVEMALILLKAGAAPTTDDYSYWASTIGLTDLMSAALLRFLINGETSQIQQDAKADAKEEAQACKPPYVLLSAIPKFFLELLVRHKRTLADYLEKMVNDIQKKAKSKTITLEEKITGVIEGIACLEFCLKGMLSEKEFIKKYAETYWDGNFHSCKSAWDDKEQSVLCKLFGIRRDGDRLQNDRLVSDPNSRGVLDNLAKLNNQLTTLLQKLQKLTVTATPSSAPSIPPLAGTLFACKRVPLKVSTTQPLTALTKRVAAAADAS